MAAYPNAGEPEAPPRIPDVMDSEDGDHWWVVGHLSDADARLALLATMLSPDGFYDRHEAYETARTVKVARRFYKPDPTDPDEERFTECPMSDPEGAAFTLMEATGE